MSCSDPRIVRVLAAAVALAATGCIETTLLASREPLDYSPIEVPEPTPPTEGAIWNGQFPSGSFLSFDRKARTVGDLVTVVVTERARARNEAQTKADSSSKLSASLSSDVGLQAAVLPLTKRLLELLLDADTNDPDAGTPINIAEGTGTNEFEGSGGTEREGRFEAVITCRVLAMLPGDVLHIRGRRAIVVNHEMQYMTLEGLVRRSDINIDNRVPSTALAEARITLDGLGVIDDKQRPGWMLRFLSWVSPL
jgi:flagellar L-ring protein precursor FlgH